MAAEVMIRLFGRLGVLLACGLGVPRARSLTAASAPPVAPRNIVLFALSVEIVASDSLGNDTPDSGASWVHADLIPEIPQRDDRLIVIPSAVGQTRMRRAPSSLRDRSRRHS